MPARELPDRPNLDQYKKQAKELVKAAKAGDARAFVLMREHHPRLKQLLDDQLHRTKFALADAQLIVARAHGFASWPTFAKHIETITRESSSRIWTRAEKALVDGDVATLGALLARHGDMLRKGPVQSSWWGGLAPTYSKGDARAIIAREHHFESWDQFAAFAEALAQRRRCPAPAGRRQLRPEPRADLAVHDGAARLDAAGPPPYAAGMDLPRTLSPGEA